MNESNTNPPPMLLMKLRMLMRLKTIWMRVLNLEIPLLRKMITQQLLTMVNILLGLGLVMMEKRRQGVMVASKNTLFVVKSMTVLI